jgi:hypothetical protein
MIYLYTILLIANICSGGIAFVAGDQELVRHSEIMSFLITILIYLEVKEGK